MTEFKNLRLRLGVSQYRLSKLSGIPRHKISTHETGYTKLSAAEIKKINRVLESVETEGKGV